ELHFRPDVDLHDAQEEQDGAGHDRPDQFELVVAVLVSSLASGPAGVAQQRVDQNRFREDKEKAGDRQDEVKQPVDAAAKRRNILGQPPAPYERSDDEQKQRRRHHDTEEDAPEFLHVTTPLFNERDGRKRPPSARSLRYWLSNRIPYFSSMRGYGKTCRKCTRSQIS